MTKKIVIVGHADGDGHLIAEQTRRNLSVIAGLDIRLLVDPVRTRDHKCWLRLDRLQEVHEADIVFFVDMMFGPQSYVDEARALVDYVTSFPRKQFYLVDHHPLPLIRLAPAFNLRAVYRQNVSECAFGPKSGMMLVAALCEGQPDDADYLATPLYATLATGMKRAAALGGLLVGEKLLALLKADRWDGIYRLGREDRQLHPSVRGWRSAAAPVSDALRELDNAAAKLLSNNGNVELAKPRSGGTDMAYDLDVGKQQLEYTSERPTLLKNTPKSPRDLGVIITLLEVAALSLTTVPGTTFTLEELIREAQIFAGDDTKLDERDIKIVLRKRTFLEKVGSEFKLR